MCFRSFLALIKCDIIGNPKAHALLINVVEGLHCCSNKLAKTTTDLSAYEQKQV